MPGDRLAEGEAEVFGDEIPVTIDGFLRSVSTRGGHDRAQVRIPSDDIAPGAYQVIDVPRKYVRVPPMLRGVKF